MTPKIDEDIEVHNKRSSIGRRAYDSGNILRLVQKETNPSADAVADLTQLLDLAKQGIITQVGYVACGKNGTVTGVVGEKKYRHTLKGLLLSLAHEV